jgi:WhiB family redox-sensing transcriptional regulator
MNITIDYSWQKDAKCGTVDKETASLFFSQGGRSAERLIKPICDTCPVKEECLNHALKYEDYGYWAGTTAKGRQRIREELGIQLTNISFESILKHAEEVLHIKETRPKRRNQAKRDKNKQNPLTEEDPYDYYGSSLEDDWSSDE